MFKAIILSVAMLLTHHGEQLDPVVIHKTGLGFWESVADGRHLTPKQRQQFIAALGSATFPADADISTQWGKQRIVDHAKAMMWREECFVGSGLLVEDYTFFDPHRATLIKHAKARGIYVVWPDDN